MNYSGNSSRKTSFIENQPPRRVSQEPPSRKSSFLEEQVSRRNSMANDNSISRPSQLELREERSPNPLRNSMESNTWEAGTPKHLSNGHRR